MKDRFYNMLTDLYYRMRFLSGFGFYTMTGAHYNFKYHKRIFFLQTRDDEEARWRRVPWMN